MDQSAVFMRPKEEIGSTSSVFASEYLKLIYESPVIYEVSGTGEKYSHHLSEMNTIKHLMELVQTFKNSI